MKSTTQIMKKMNLLKQSAINELNKSLRHGRSIKQVL